MAQVYAIVHDDRECLVFIKNLNQRYHKYQQYPPDPDPFSLETSEYGIHTKKGGSLPCFSGGGQEGTESAEDGAKREFREETGCGALRNLKSTNEYPHGGYIAVFFM
jgi:8-oxo-dGTP pyrophosphatase MutT (NUDIX family)